MRDFNSKKKNKGKQYSNKRGRFLLYKIVAACMHGKLGFANRRELPDCVVNYICKLWPADTKASTRAFASGATNSELVGGMQ